MEEDQQQQHGQSHQQQQQNPNSPNQITSERNEPVRSRWTPKPEQILILESIFNSGMVNPPKDETVRIRKLLEKFGAVGDANVFYWFQNRRSRSRRRQRQLMATAQISGGNIGTNPCHQQHYYNNNISSSSSSLGGFNGSSFIVNSSSGSSSSYGGGVGGGQEGFVGGFFSPLNQMNFPEIDHSSSSSAGSSVFFPSENAPNLNNHFGFEGNNVTGFITVFINGVATEIPRGPIDIKTVFGEDVMLVHSSGFSLPTNDFGFLMQNLQHGESYFLVSKQTQV